MIIDRVEQRYQNDVEFRTVVDMLQSLVLKLQMTPREIREAAPFACILIERRRPPVGSTACLVDSSGRWYCDCHEGNALNGAWVTACTRCGQRKPSPT